MITMDFFSKNKTKIINAGIILLAIFIALYLYSMQNQQLDTLVENKNEEIKKSEVIESLNRVEKRIDSYKQTFSRKDLGSVIGALTDIAKDTRVQVISVKPGAQQQYPEYIKTSFLIVVRVADYHALGQFISKVENYRDLFLVEDINISTVNNQTDKRAERNLDISLKISTITCL
ncbi:MAG: type 4a pilus biogenesis protein PilO [Candidatus Omnitrophica bacterium]|nr:type 4a pilus biogenesis protein PilO [Candidatus Omnitrophota bacterium]MDD5690955.1 type 4a pilus biogenesis protein PilO [Candidatus Omnitrophota bacterium]